MKQFRVFNLLSLIKTIEKVLQTPHKPFKALKNIFKEISDRLIDYTLI